jgi:23S rRNA U2552 (ribose-2'-O)-methylase RlmE/FtsJ
MESKHYRSASALKLLELDSLVKGGLITAETECVVDLAAAPGGWTQVALELMRKSRRPVATPDIGATGPSLSLPPYVIAVDPTPIAPLRGMSYLKRSLYSPEVLQDIVRTCESSSHWNFDAQDTKNVCSAHNWFEVADRFYSPQVILHDGAMPSTDSRVSLLYNQNNMAMMALRLSTQLFEAAYHRSLVRRLLALLEVESEKQTASVDSAQVPGSQVPEASAQCPRLSPQDRALLCDKLNPIIRNRKSSEREMMMAQPSGRLLTAWNVNRLSDEFMSDRSGGLQRLAGIVGRLSPEAQSSLLSTTPALIQSIEATGTFVTKIFPSFPAVNVFLNRCRMCYESVDLLRLESSKSSSREVYVVCRRPLLQPITTTSTGSGNTNNSSSQKKAKDGRGAARSNSNRPGTKDNTQKNDSKAFFVDKSRQKGSPSTSASAAASNTPSHSLGYKVKRFPTKKSTFCLPPFVQQNATGAAGGGPTPAKEAFFCAGCFQTVAKPCDQCMALGWQL